MIATLGERLQNQAARLGFIQPSNQFLTSGGMASIGGDLPEADKEAANEIVKAFGEKVRRYSRLLQVAASLLKVQQCNFLLVAKDTASLHFVFAEAPGGTSINYRDLSTNGRIELQSTVHQVGIDVGDVAWAFSISLNASAAELDTYIQNIVQQYVETTLQNQQKPDKKISGEAVSIPEIASGLEKFRVDHPVGSKTAFIIMQFDATTQRPAQRVNSSVRQQRGSVMTMPKNKQIIGFAAWLAASFIAAAIGAAASIQASPFYAQLVRPEWAPPAGVFGPVWTILYTLMGVAAWLVWRVGGFQAAGTALALFVLQLAVNALWSWLFFGWHLGTLAVADIILLWVLIVATLVAFWRIRPMAGALLIPYLLWVSFASVLNYSVWQLNPQILG